MPRTHDVPLPLLLLLQLTSHGWRRWQRCCICGATRDELSWPSSTRNLSTSAQPAINY